MYSDISKNPTSEWVWDSYVSFLWRANSHNRPFLAVNSGEFPASPQQSAIDLSPNEHRFGSP